MSLADLARTPAKSKARSLTDLASKPASGNGFWGAIGQGVQSAERAVGGVVSGALNSQPVRDTARWGIETVSNPDIALMNALSVLGRTNRAGIVAAHDAKGGNGFLNYLGGAARGVFDGDSDQRNIERGEELMHLGPRHNPNTVLGQGANALRDFAYSTATEPGSYIPVIGEGLTALRGVLGAGQAAREGMAARFPQTHAALQNIRGAVGQAAGNFRHRADLDPALQNEGRAVFTGIDNSERTNATKQNQADEAFLKAHRKTMRQTGQVPHEVRQRLLQDAYVHGNDQMRRQAIEYGYQPKPGEEAVAPTGLDIFNVRDQYEPLMNPNHSSGAAPANPGTVVKGQPVRQGYNLPQRAWDRVRLGPLDERVAYRLRKGVDFRRQGLTQKRQMEELGLRLPTSYSEPLYADSGDIQQAMARLNRYVKDSGKAEAAIMKAPDKYAESPGLAAISDIGRDALTALNLPHKLNVAAGALIKHGPHAIAGGLKNYLTGIDPELQSAMEKYGAAGSAATSAPGRFSPRKLIPEPIRNWSDKDLHRFENAFRADSFKRLGGSSVLPNEFNTTLTHIDPEEPNLFRYQSTKGEPEFSPRRGGTFFSIGKPFDQYKGDGLLGGEHLVTRMENAKNPLDIIGNPGEPESSLPGVGVAHMLRPGKPTAQKLLEGYNQPPIKKSLKKGTGSDAPFGSFMHKHNIKKYLQSPLYFPDKENPWADTLKKYGIDPKKSAEEIIHAMDVRYPDAEYISPRNILDTYLKALGHSPEEIKKIRNLEGNWAAIDRIGSDLARRAGHDAIRLRNFGSDPEDNEHEFFALHPSAHRLPNPGGTFKESTYNQPHLDAVSKNYKASFGTRKALGDYHAKSPATIFARKVLGSPFAQWHTKVVNEMGAGSDKRHLRNYLSALNAYNKNINKNQPYTDNLNKPPDEFARSVFDPIGYYTSPSTTGLAGSLIAGARDRFKPNSLGLQGQASDLMRLITPGGDLGITALEGKGRFPSKADINHQLIMNMIGGYAKSKPSKYETQILNIMQRTGVDRPQAEKSAEMLDRLLKRYER